MFKNFPRVPIDNWLATPRGVDCVEAFSGLPFSRVVMLLVAIFALIILLMVWLCHGDCHR